LEQRTGAGRSSWPKARSQWRIGRHHRRTRRRGQAQGAKGRGGADRPAHRPPQAEYTCDSTLVELEIAEQATGKTWSLKNDVVPDLLGGGANPHADSLATRRSGTSMTRATG